MRLLFALFLVAFTSLSSFSQNSQEVVVVGDKVPYFNFVLDEVASNSKEFEHKIVWINFFATWCPPCRAELQLIQKEIYNKYKDRCDFQFIAVGYGHTIEQIRVFQVENELDLPFAKSSKIVKFWSATKGVIPRNYIVNREGVVFYSGDGFNRDEFQRLFDVIKSELGE